MFFLRTLLLSRRSSTRLLFPLALALCLASMGSETDGADFPLPSKERFHLYLLIGQSNMAGRGVLEKKGEPIHPRVLMFTKEKKWAPGAEPLHFDKVEIAGAGLGTSFAQVMAEANPEVTIGLVPCAVGGTPLSRWQKEGDLYEQALVRIRAAMQDGTIKGVLWHQGESDAGDPKLASSYAERLGKMITDLRTDLETPDLPFVAGKLGEFLPERTREGNPNLWKEVNEQLVSVPKLVPRVVIVESTGLVHKGDSVHFDTASLRTFGERYAEAMQKLQAK